jgi:hypothetical protein
LTLPPGVKCATALNENFSFIISYSSPELRYLAVPLTRKPVYIQTTFIMLPLS